MSQIKCAALLDKAFRFMRAATGKETKRINNEIGNIHLEKARLIDSKINNMKSKKPSPAVQANLETGLKQNASHLNSLTSQYEDSKRATTKARAYLLGGGVVAGGVGVGAAVHHKKKKDNQILERINSKYQSEGD
jgi:hypothetical protein